MLTCHTAKATHSSTLAGQSSEVSECRLISVWLLNDLHCTYAPLRTLSLSVDKHTHTHTHTCKLVGVGWKSVRKQQNKQQDIEDTHTHTEKGEENGGEMSDVRCPNELREHELLFQLTGTKNDKDCSGPIKSSLFACTACWESLIIHNGMPSTNCGVWAS